MLERLARWWRARNITFDKVLNDQPSETPRYPPGMQFEAPNGTKLTYLKNGGSVPLLAGQGVGE